MISQYAAYFRSWIDLLREDHCKVIVMKYGTIEIRTPSVPGRINKFEFSVHCWTKER